MKTYWTKQVTMIERIALSGPVNTEREAKKELVDEGYQIMYAGPYTNDEMRQNVVGAPVDVTRFLILAERNANIAPPVESDWEIESAPT